MGCQSNAACSGNEHWAQSEPKYGSEEAHATTLSYPGGNIGGSSSLNLMPSSLNLMNLDGDIHFGAQMGKDAVFNAGWLTTANGQTLPGLQNLSGAQFTMKNISTGDDNTFQSLQNLCMMMTANGAVPCAQSNGPIQSMSMMQPMSMTRI